MWRENHALGSYYALENGNVIKVVCCYYGEIVRGKEGIRAMSIDHGYALVNLVWEAIVQREK